MEFDEVVDKTFINKKFSATMKRLNLRMGNMTGNPDIGNIITEDGVSVKGLDEWEVKLWLMKQEDSSRADVEYIDSKYALTHIVKTAEIIRKATKSFLS